VTVGTADRTSSRALALYLDRLEPMSGFPSPKKQAMPHEMAVNAPTVRSRRLP